MGIVILLSANHATILMLRVTETMIVINNLTGQKV